MYKYTFIVEMTTASVIFQFITEEMGYPSTVSSAGEASTWIPV